MIRAIFLPLLAMFASSAFAGPSVSEGPNPLRHRCEYERSRGISSPECVGSALNPEQARAVIQKYPVTIQSALQEAGIPSSSYPVGGTLKVSHSQGKIVHLYVISMNHCSSNGRRGICSPVGCVYIRESQRQGRTQATIRADRECRLL